MGGGVHIEEGGRVMGREEGRSTSRKHLISNLAQDNWLEWRRDGPAGSEADTFHRFWTRTDSQGGSNGQPLV